MPYKDPVKAREASKIRSKRWYQRHLEEVRERHRQYAREHKAEAKVRSYKCDQKRNAPCHAILDEAGIERKCVRCGAIEKLCTHHIDENHSNNSLSNLQWLCMSCHNRVHAELRRNKST